MKLSRLLCVLTGALALTFALSAQSVELRSFKSAEEEARFKALSEELRCLVCQNQSLADSDAELARDLRREVHEMIDAGKSNDEILDFLVARYGDFVLYRPPLNASTLLLWVGPFVILIGALVALFISIRKRASEASEGADNLDDAERKKVQALLDKHRGENA